MLFICEMPWRGARGMSSTEGAHACLYQGEVRATRSGMCWCTEGAGLGCMAPGGQRGRRLWSFGLTGKSTQGESPLEWNQPHWQSEQAPVACSYPRGWRLLLQLLRLRDQGQRNPGWLHGVRTSCELEKEGPWVPSMPDVGLTLPFLCSSLGAGLSLLQGTGGIWALEEHPSFSHLVDQGPDSLLPTNRLFPIKKTFYFSLAFTESKRVLC